MKLTYNGSETKEIEINNRAEFYPTVAKMIVDEEAGKRLMVTASTEEGCVTYRVGVRSGTQTIFEEINTMPDSYLSDLKPAYLTCVEPQVMEYLYDLHDHPGKFDPDTFYSDVSSRCKNAYKQYKLIPENGHVTAYYGRMAVQRGKLFGERSVEYPLSSYWLKYFEKIGKGYVDRTRLYMPEVFGQKKTESKPEKIQTVQKDVISNEASKSLFAKLKSLAKRAVEAAQVKVPVTDAIIEAASRDVKEMRKAARNKDVVSFNLALLDIISILQRPVATGDGTGVKRLLAVNESDFSGIISREEDLLKAMEGSIAGGSSTAESGGFSQLGIEVYEATSKQKAQVLRHLDPALHGKVKRIYRVIPQKQKRAFDAYISRNGIENVRLLWHGSRNENWLSIIRNSLLLNPDAIITGKMFGNGIYFAPSSSKSWNYTSYHGTTWANGNSSCAYMGLYAVAYGQQYDVHFWDPSTDYKGMVFSNGCNCLHAHAGTSLRADEIVFYDEAAVLLDYIVEFE